MSPSLAFLDRVIERLRIGNIALGAALLLMPLVLAAGFLLDRPHRPGEGISARAGLQAAIKDIETSQKPGHAG